MTTNNGTTTRQTPGSAFVDDGFVSTSPTITPGSEFETGVIQGPPGPTGPTGAAGSSVDGLRIIQMGTTTQPTIIQFTSGGTDVGPQVSISEGAAGEADNIFPVTSLPTDGNRPDGNQLEDGDVAVLTSNPHTLHIWNAGTSMWEENDAGIDSVSITHSQDRINDFLTVTVDGVSSTALNIDSLISGGRDYIDTVSYKSGEIVSYGTRSTVIGPSTGTNRRIFISVVDNNLNNNPTLDTDNSHWVEFRSSTIQVNDTVVDSPNLDDSSANRGITWNADDNGNITGVAGADSTKQDVLSDFYFTTNIPLSVDDIVADREYVFWITNNTGTTSNVISAGDFNLSGRVADASRTPLVGSDANRAVADRVSVFYVSWNQASIEFFAGIDEQTGVQATINGNVFNGALGPDSYGGGGTPITYEFESVASATADQAILRLNPSEGDNDDVTLIGGSGINLNRAANGNLTFSSGNVPHAQLRGRINLDHTALQRPFSDTVVTGTPTPFIQDAAAGDVINNHFITSVHSTYRDDTIQITPLGQTFQINILSTAPAQTITFTCAYTVNYTIGGTTDTAHLTGEVTLPIREAPVAYYFGTFTQAQFNARNTMTAAQIISALASTANNISYPVTLSYTGSDTSDLYPVLFARQSDGTPTTLISGGNLFSFQTRTGVNNGGTNFVLVVGDDPVSSGTHQYEWRL